MLLRLSAFFPLFLVALAYHAAAQQQQISGSSLYPDELVPLITRADALLTAGKFSDAAQAYSEAIGECACLLLRGSVVPVKWKGRRWKGFGSLAQNSPNTVGIGLGLVVL